MSEPLSPSDSEADSEPAEPAGSSDLLKVAEAGEEPGLKAWEQQPEETAAAYTAFCRYLYMAPAERSLSAAYRQETGRNQAGQASGQWSGWYASHDWKARALAYDTYRAGLERQRREREQLDALSAFSAQQHKLNAAATEAAILLMEKATKALKDIKPETLALRPELIPIFLRTATAAATAGSDAQARALAVDELLGHLDEQERQREAEDAAEGGA